MAEKMGIMCKTKKQMQRFRLEKMETLAHSFNLLRELSHISEQGKLEISFKTPFILDF
jgi:hypothetical protein